LGALGGRSSYGMAINSYKHVAGYSTITANDERVHAFLYNGAKMIDLGSLGGTGNRDNDVRVALAVNNWDQVVGYTYLPTVGEMPTQQVAFVWSRDGYGGGKMVNLNKLVNETGKNYLLVSATGINDNGQIVANAYDTQNGGVHAVLLTPVKSCCVVVVTNMKTDKQSLSKLRKVGERRCGARPGVAQQMSAEAHGTRLR